jgi:signal transduction histidine kinase
MGEPELRAPRPEDCLAGGGEMGTLIRSVDWAATPLGPVASWPQSLRTAVSMMLESRFGTYIAWGPRYVQFYNDAYRPILGATKHPAVGKSAAETFAESWHIIGPMFDGVMRGDAVGSEDWMLPLDRFGYLEECYFTFCYSPIRDESGGVGGVLVTVTETTTRVLGERRLRALRDLAALASKAKVADDIFPEAARILEDDAGDVPFALFYVDGGGPEAARLVAASGFAGGGVDVPAAAWPLAELHGARRMVIVDDLGRRAGRFPGGPWPDPPRQAAVLAIAPPGHAPYGWLVAGISARRALDDAYRDFLELIASNLAGALANARALEEERRRAEALAEIDRAKTAFFSNVSHEFRTPLTLLLSPLEEEVADAARAGDAARHARLEMMQRNGGRLLRLVNALLDFSRIEAGRVEAVYEPLDVAALTAELASVFRSAVERAGLTLVVDCPPLGTPVYVDRDMWEKIVLNLLSNALKFTFDGRITVRVRRAAGAAVLEVEDTGIGIAAEEQPRIFDRFHRVRDARARTHEGTGIGLALVQELVKLHRGSVTVRSVVGAGTTFTVSVPTGTAHLPEDRIGAGRTLPSTATNAAAYVEEALRWMREPAAESGAREAEPAAPGVSGERAQRILLADDNADMRDYVGRLLAAHWTVEAVADGMEALRAAQARTPDLVLADVMMPGLDGFELLRRLRADTRTALVPVILLSARAGEEATLEGLRAGADDYLVKPFSARELLARVRAHLALARARAEASAREHAAVERALEGQAALEAANKAKDEFLAMLSHELRTPLSAILGWARMLGSRALSEADVERAVGSIQRNAELQAQLIDDLLDVSRIVAGKLTLEVEPLQMSTVVRQAVDLVQAAADEAGILLVLNVGSGDAWVRGDSARLQQVVWNLVSNAIKFTSRGGRVELELRTAGGWTELRVSDTGRGIAPDLLPHIFDRFRQGPRETRRGLGLGLAIVQHLVQMHGGTVTAASAGEGKGATFTVRLPALQRAGVAATPGEADGGTSGAAALEGLHLLVVDDDADTRELLAAILALAGARVTTAGSVEEARAKWAEHAFDVIVTDLAMPREDGYALIRHLRAGGGARVPAVVVSAYARGEDRARVLAAGFDGYVSKPAEPETLIRVVREAARRDDTLPAA